MFTGLISWIINFIFILVITYLISRRLRSGRFIIDLIVFVFLWIFFVTLFLLLAGLAGYLVASTLGLLSLFGLAILLALPSVRSELHLFVGDVGQFRRFMKGWWGQLPRWVQVVTIVFLIVTVIRTVFLIWALPPFIWDSLTYHLTNVAQWVQDRKISVFDTPVQRIYSAANYEVFATWFAVFLHHDVIIEASGLPAYLLAGLSVYAIGRSLDIPPWASWIGSMAYLSTPGLLLAATGTKNDPLVAALFLMSFALVIHSSRRASKVAHEKAFGPVIALSMALLYAAGTKAYIAHLIPGLLLVGCIFVIKTGDTRFWLRAPRMFLADLRRRGLGFTILVVLLLAGGLFLGSYWYLRNWMLMGNPFYPYSVEVTGTRVLDSGESGFRFGLRNLFDNIELFVMKFGDKQYRIAPDLPNTTGWGWIIYGMGIPASIWALTTHWKYRVLFAGFTLSLLGLFTSSPLSPWNMRYVIWFPAFFCIGIALFFNSFWALKTFPRRILLVLFIFSMSMNVLMTLDYNLISIEEFRTILRIPTWERHAGMLHVHVPEDYESVYTFVPSDAILAYNLDGNGFIYPLYRADYSQRIVYLPFSDQDSCREVAAMMEAKGTRYLFVAPGHSKDENIALLEQCATSGDVIRERAGGLFVLKNDRD